LLGLFAVLPPSTVAAMKFFSSRARALAGGPFRRRDLRGRGKYRENYRTLAAALVEVIEFHDHLDVGCGQGLLIEPLVTRHGKDSYGVEGSKDAHEFMAPEVKPRVRIANVGELEVDRSYDLVSCVEVLEHVPEAESDRAVDFLTRSARGFVYLSAAIPGQAGIGHINCQPSLFWILAFARHGFVLDLGRSGALVERIRGMQPAHWLPQNALIFARQRAA
jgi:SAM-dependent methyltransferase